ncbi:unannotated protein [freshwater metagenome]|uniref:Unannotated protein n=1 Tax=freshwater metagenome TaxID=449393 RepID=A0A6J7A638_9ZZZZ
MSSGTSGTAGGVLEGVTVLDLSWGISGPAAAMLLGDAGADVYKIEPPGGDPFRAHLSGYRVWQRNKKSAELDLRDPVDHETFLALVDRADVVIESFAPGVAEKLGIDHVTLRARNPRLVHCSISGYGLEGKHAARPAFDALVSARTGHMWEARGVAGGSIARLAGVEGMMPGVVAPAGCWVGAERPGPLMPGVPWASMATMYLATLAINAALRVRGLTGRGQHVHTSLMQGAICSTLGAWQRVEHPDAENFQTWITDPRAPRGFFRTSDDLWTHHWVPLPGFLFGVSAGEKLEWTEGESPRKSSSRIGLGPEEIVALHELTPLMQEAVGRFPGHEWEQVAAQLGVPVQIVRSPEQALLDPLFLADGCVVEVDDPETGPIRQVGAVLNLTSSPSRQPTPAAQPGEHTDEARARAREPIAPFAPPLAPGRALGSPLEGIRVLDLGLAVAGPFGTQLLADLGAEVIKVSTLTDDYWMSNHIAMCCNRGKRSIALNLKTPEGMQVLRELVAGTDIVQHNMRYDAAERLGVDYESLRAVNPALIYCHTRGFEKGPRTALPGNDQTGAALAGTTWLDGGLDRGGNPVWSTTSLGDTGNGFLSAIGMVQALAHRDRTGEGQFLDTAIVYAQLLNASSAWISPDDPSVVGHRPSLDKDQLGWSALYRVYPCADATWLCVVALDQSTFERLVGAIGRNDLAADERYSSPEARAANDAELIADLSATFAQRDASAWFGVLDADAVPCEVSSPDFVLSLFDDQEFIDKGWVTSYTHPKVGRIDVMGLLFDFDETPGKIWGPPFVPGQHSGPILRELGYDDDAIEQLVATRVVLDRSE